MKSALQLRLEGSSVFKRVGPWRGSPACGRPHWSKADSFCSPIGRLEWVVMHLKLRRQLGKTASYLIEKTEHNWKMLQRKWKERDCAVIVTLKVWFDKLQCGVRLLNNICTHTLIRKHSNKYIYRPLQNFLCPSPNQISCLLPLCTLLFTNRLHPANSGWSL